MQVPQSRESLAGIDGAFSVNHRCDALTKIAKTVGTAAGYLQRSNSGSMLADAQGLLMRSPERSVLAAAGIGLLLGTVLRNRR